MSEGRDFHQDAQAKYALPNDSPEHSRLDEQARQLTIAFGGRLQHAPITSPRRILDIGCGTGYVTQQFARLFPDATVYGLDLSLVPSRANAASNAHFLQGNILTQPATQWQPQDPASSSSSSSPPPGIPGDEAVFDLVFHRLLLVGMSEWPRYVQIQHGLLRPGGWVEAHELVGVVYDGAGRAISDNWGWYQRVHKEWEANGLDLEAGLHMQKWMEEAGFEAVQAVEYVLPVGSEGQTTPEMREFGDFFLENAIGVWQIIIDKSLGPAGVSEAERKQLQAEVRRDISQPGIKTSKMFATFGRKP